MSDPIMAFAAYVLPTALWGVVFLVGIIAAFWVGAKVHKFWSDSFILCEIGRYLMIGVACAVAALLVIAFIVYMFFAIGFAGLGVYHAFGG